MEPASPEAEQRNIARKKARLASLNRTVEDILPYDSLQSQADMDASQGIDVSPSPGPRASLASASGQPDEESPVNVMTAQFRDSGSVPVQQAGLFDRLRGGPARRMQSGGMQVRGECPGGVCPIPNQQSGASRYPMPMQRATTTVIESSPVVAQAMPSGQAPMQATTVPQTNIQRWQASVADRIEEPMTAQDMVNLHQAILRDMPTFGQDANRASRMARFADDIAANASELMATQEQREKQSRIIDQTLKDRETARRSEELNIRMHDEQTYTYYVNARESAVRGLGQYSRLSPQERAVAMVELEQRNYAPRRGQNDPPLDTAALMRTYTAEAVGHDLGRLVAGQVKRDGSDVQWSGAGAQSIDNRMIGVYWNYPDPAKQGERLTGEDLRVKMNADLIPIVSPYIAESLAKGSGMSPRAFDARAEYEANALINSWAKQISIGHESRLAPDTWLKAVQAYGDTARGWIKQGKELLFQETPSRETPGGAAPMNQTPQQETPPQQEGATT